MCSSDLIAILRGGPYNVVTQLRDIPSCKSSFLEVHLAQGVTFWVSTHAPQPLVTRPGSVPTFLSYYAHGLPLGVALSWVVSIPGSPRGGVGTSRVRLPPIDTKTMALEPPFSYCSEVPGPEASSSVSRPLVVSPPPRSFLPVGTGGDTVDALIWRRLILAIPYPGDALTWRHLILTTL